ncbi:ribosomal protein S18-alanine N-acetyltransferase [Streptococcus cuniculipharyngis]|uniref:[Ribosomal protein bS18]-alanine N-acetyltransferase n=1 Tax=Streptococcus cuniculipharyngis TaxID=1562651 RepID=A0A5C5SDG5_9STRE|nr:ribosomal protein S18-alanine N-acetyltransferase [Streptococcus cuniculipharyngis]TWS98220.1 ribosomal-protein-alanine N-acetyltransferase [Streptococcus cuniculipharyngis]
MTTTKLTISNGSRQSLQDQVQGIYAILRDVYEQSPWSLAQIEADVTQGNTTYFFAEQAGDLVGFLALQDLMGELELTNLAVKRAYQGRGIAKRLLQSLSEEQSSIFLEVRQSNVAAQYLYQTFGFEPIGQRKNYYHNPVEDALIMKRE